MRKLLAALGAALAVYLLLLAGLAFAMRQPPAVFGRIMSHMPGPMFMVLPFESLWMRARAGHLNAGDRAPDFTLPTLDRASRVRLADIEGRPVVLVFGSYT
jgi:AhpC/TSA family